MKKILFLAFLALLLAGCQTGTNPTDDKETDTPATPEVTTPETPETPAPALPDTPIVKPGETKTVYVKNSKWVTVKTVTITVPAASVRAADEGTTAEALQKEVIAYNLAHTDDQQTILDSDVPIAESPYVDVYMCDASTHEIKRQYLQWSRQDYVDRNWAFVADSSSMGWVLYVDNIPPVPVPEVDTRTPYEKYALYLIDAAGKIMYEEHCADTDWAGSGYKSVDEYYVMRKSCYEMQARGDGKGEWVVAGKLYTAP